MRQKRPDEVDYFLLDIEEGRIEHKDAGKVAKYIMDLEERLGTIIYAARTRDLSGHPELTALLKAWGER